MSVFFRSLIVGVSLLMAMTAGFSAVRAAPVTVTFSGLVDQFNFGPLTPFSTLSGEIVLDDTVIPTGVNNNFGNVILSLTLTVDDPGGQLVFTGSGGRVQQFSNAAGTTDFIQIGLGGTAGGTLSGAANGIDLESFGIDFRGPALFGDPTILATGLSEGDFSYSFTTLNFDAPGLAGLAVERALNTVTFSGEPGPIPVSAPAAPMYFGLGLLAVAYRLRRRTAV